MSASSASKAKPYVQVACICEKVLIEPDNVASLIRIVDTYFLSPMPDPLPPGLNIGHELMVFISLKSGDVVGDFEVGLRLTEPDGTERPVRTWPVEFRGVENGVNAKIGFALQNPKFGLYWIDVMWEDEVLTRIPFRLKPIALEQTDEALAPNETTTH